MTKKLLSNALVISAFLALAACGNGGGSDLASNDLANNPASNETLADDTSDEQAFNADDKSENDAPEAMVEESAIASNSRDSILKNYDYVDPGNVVPTRALENAMVYFHQNKSRIKNQKYVSVIDFSRSSKAARFHIIDMKTGKVWSIHVAHGKGSDSNHDGYAEKFSNRSGSKASSLGYYLTGSTYQGSNGYSLKLDGLSSTNSNARGRAVVIHGASYVREKSVKQGRSWGCPAVAMELRTKVINMLKGGSLIYAVN
ncbi:murein L,D-transpeptidase catalytic domain family protein [Bdellovibrio sp. 22V]|uniref:murein L,D-transpeptidase catalytic domain family protein n=1 Tax=Bdellovibrio TaxID=958 RepID=UPI002543D211|nr:murein L,D-transpeptidase catalytic domain family protein [Bdellovibrio sp. 22V]WII72508.1 murein L,D-transpeptidase catalytic domain family protein [Bdellovibrio sp. 22V]